MHQFVHYFEDPQSRERKLTHDVVQYHWSQVAQAMGLNVPHQVFVELDKKLYGTIGDVDYAIWVQPNTSCECLIGIEVKTTYLQRDGTLKAQKKEKHQKQIQRLQQEGWDYIWLLDFIVTEPAHDWRHPQSFDGFHKYEKVAGPSIGHIVFQINSIMGRPESEAGSISQKVLAAAERQPSQASHNTLLSAFYNADQSNSTKWSARYFYGCSA